MVCDWRIPAALTQTVPTVTKRPAAFLDRDGTMNVRPPEHEYVETVDEFAWIPGAAAGAARLAEAGYLVIVVSNQRGVATGRVSERVLRGIEQRIQEEVGRYGGAVTQFRYCVHDLDEHCSCRKPKPGLLLDAAEEHGLELVRSWMIGDSPSDIFAGRAAGCRTALVGAEPAQIEPDLRVSSLAAAAQAILALASGLSSSL